MKALLALLVGLLIAFPAFARNQVWNQATWVVNAGAGSDSITYTGVLGVKNGSAAACSIAVQMPDQSSPQTIPQVQAGQFEPVAATKVMATNTTCNPVIVYGSTGN